jgi:O-antigen/teichoic acid export membrane protein
MVPMLINMSNGVLINVLDALNKRMVRSYILLLTTILNVILTIVFIDIWGVIGACLATAISVILGQIILMNIYYAKKLKIKVLSLFYYSFKGIFINQIIASAIAFAVGYFYQQQIPFILCSRQLLCFNLCSIVFPVRYE